LQQNDKAVLVYVTYPDVEAAERTGAALVESGLAACVNILPGMVSIYVWEGARQRDAEAVMIVKTRAALADRVVAETLQRHPYDTPAVLVLPVEGGSPRYLDWIFGQTADSGPANPVAPSTDGTPP
jgi:periplasmic divalent cation tolerance protein